MFAYTTLRRFKTALLTGIMAAHTNSETSLKRKLNALSLILYFKHLALMYCHIPIKKLSYMFSNSASYY